MYRSAFSLGRLARERYVDQRSASIGLRLRQSLALALWLVLLTACPTRARLDAGSMKDFKAAYVSNTYYLRQSVYFGAFYDDTRRFLLDAKNFKDLRLMTAPDGDLIIPAPAQGIIPAGTKVQVLAVDFPTSAAIFKRPLFTPRYNTWLVLKVARFKGDANLFREGEFIYVLPTTARSPEALQSTLQALLSSESMDPWLQQRSQEVRLAIFEKRAQQGLSFDELVAALGLPEKMHRAKDGEHQLVTARFGSTEVLLVDDRATEIRDVDMDSPMQGEVRSKQ